MRLKYASAVLGCREADRGTACNSVILSAEAGANVVCAMPGRYRKPSQSLARLPTNVQLQVCFYYIRQQCASAL